jgi:hypothetical protein
MTVTQADLQQLIDDLSAAIDRKNALMDELVAACRIAINTLNGCNGSYIGINADNHYEYYRDGIDHVESVLAATIAKAERGVSQP